MKRRDFLKVSAAGAAATAAVASPAIAQSSPEIKWRMGGQCHSSRAAIRGYAPGSAYTSLTGLADRPAGHFFAGRGVRNGGREQGYGASRAVMPGLRCAF